MNDTPPVPVPETSEGKLDRKVLEALVCPVTRGVLIYSAKDQELVSRGAGLAFGGPLSGHLLQVRDQQIRRRLQILRPAVAIAVGAVVPGSIVGPGAIARAAAMTVEILTP